MIWLFRRRQRRVSPEVTDTHNEVVAQLAEVKTLRADAAQVSSSLRESRERNHFAEGFRVAMGGGKA